MKLSAILEPLVAAGVDAATILAAVRAWEEQQTDALERRRANDRERQERRRHVKSRDVTVTVSSHAGATRVEDNLLPKEISGKEEKKDTPPSARVSLDAFKAELSPILDAGRIDALCAVRRKKGATFSAHAGRLLAKALRDCPDPSAAADEMVLRNWTGIKPEWLENRRANGPPRRQQGNVVEANIARRIRRNEPAGGRLDHSDVELLPPDGSKLRAVVGDLGQALSRPFGSGDH